MAKKLELSVDYDSSADVLYVSLGEPRAALSYEAGEGLLVRKDPKSGAIIAVTVLNYLHQFRRLPDISWLRKIDLPTPLVKYLQERPSF
jgi:uncharacterized protein YuzE